MQEKIYKPIGTEHSLTIGKTTFMVKSFTDKNAKNTAEDLIVNLLKSKVTELMREEKSA